MAAENWFSESFPKAHETVMGLRAASVSMSRKKQPHSNLVDPSIALACMYRDQMIVAFKSTDTCATLVSEMDAHIGQLRAKLAELKAELNPNQKDALRQRYRHLASSSSIWRSPSQLPSSDAASSAITSSLHS